jgi:putative flippase GtrA
MNAAPPVRRSRLEFLRFLAVGMLNAAVGYGIYALLVFLGCNIFVAQAGGHVLGTMFNFVSHSRLVFNMQPSLLPYLASSGMNYVAGLLFLALMAQFVASPYLAGFLALVCTAVFSYTSLKVIAFRAGRTAP